MRPGRSSPSISSGPRSRRHYAIAQSAAVRVDFRATIAPCESQVLDEEMHNETKPTCITTNRLFKDWPKVFPDPLNAQIIAERITEIAEVFLLEKSYRHPPRT